MAMSSFFWSQFAIGGIDRNVLLLFGGHFPFRTGLSVNSISVSIKFSFFLNS